MALATGMGKVEKRMSGRSEGGVALDLGSRGRAFEPLYSDKNPSEITDFRGVFLFLVYCSAEFGKCLTIED